LEQFITATLEHAQHRPQETRVSAGVGDAVGRVQALSRPPTTVATRWRQALGLKPDSHPCWYAVLKYPVGEVGDLFRPTQLDADWSGYHHPSPAGVPVWRGGCTMDCRGESDRPLSEYVHQQIDHKPEHWTLAGAV